VRDQRRGAVAGARSRHGESINVGPKARVSVFSRQGDVESLTRARQRVGQMELTRRQWIVLAVLVFVAAFAVRIAVIKLTPRGDYFTDLEIYRGSGELILNGVNPYDFSDKIALRSALRQQAHSPFVRDDQARWDYYTSGNLPMNLLFFAGVSAISDTPWFHRYTYAFFDSVLSVVVVWFVIRHWSRKQGALAGMLGSLGMTWNRALLAERLLIGLALACFSPVLLKAGVVFPEDKGIEVLLILAAIACWRSCNYPLWYWGGAVFLGLSIAFKGLGVFLAPLFVGGLLASPSRSWSRAVLFTLVVALVAAVWIPPFWPGVASMVQHRLVLASAQAPQHASIWVLPGLYLPSLWNYFRSAAMLLVAGVSLWGYWRKRIGVDLLCATLSLDFVVVWLINGGVDRQNIGTVPALLVLGTVSVNAALLCLAPYLLITGIGGLIARGVPGENVAGLGMLLFLLMYFGVLCWLSFASRDMQEEVAA
jgi:hypothetical protein